MALFITFEGGEGCGKSTQSKLLYERLAEAGIPTVLTHEPGGTHLGDKIRQVLKHDNDTQISPLVELLLFNAARAQLLEEVIRPALAAGKVVVCDRYADSTIAYQSYGRGLALKSVEQANEAATGGLKPDLTILLDTEAERGLSYKDREDRFERQDIAFHNRVRQGYLELYHKDPQRWLIIDAATDKKQVADIVWQKVSQLLTQA